MVCKNIQQIEFGSLAIVDVYSRTWKSSRIILQPQSINESCGRQYAVCIWPASIPLFSGSQVFLSCTMPSSSQTDSMSAPWDHFCRPGQSEGHILSASVSGFRLGTIPKPSQSVLTWASPRRFTWAIGKKVFILPAGDDAIKMPAWHSQGPP